MSDQSTTILQGYLGRGMSGDVVARQRLLELTRDRLMRHARRHLHGTHARLEPFEQTDDMVQQLYLKIQNQERFWVNARGQPVRSLAEFFGHSSAWMREPSPTRRTRISPRPGGAGQHHPASLGQAVVRHLDEQRQVLPGVTARSCRSRKSVAATGR